MLAFVLGLGTALTAVTAPPAAAEAPAGAQARAVPGAQAAPGQFFRVRGRLVDEVVIAAGATITVQVAGRAGIPAANVDSVAINIAASGRTSSGGVTAYPSNAPMPDTIAVWFRNWFYAHNLLFVKVGPDGKIKLTNTDPSSTVKVFVDAHGYTVSEAASVAGSTFVPVKPARIGQITVPAKGSALAEPLGKGGIPSSGVSDVMFTMSGRSDTHGTIVTYPSDAAMPGDTTLDVGQNLLVQNQVISRPGADGKVKFTNSGTKAVTLTLDAVGYFAEPEAAVTGSSLHPIVPHNLVTDVPVPAGGTYTVEPLGKGGVPASGVAGVALVVTNYYNSTGTGVLRVHPSGEAPTEAHGVAVQQAHAYGGAMPARVGADGKIVIHNDSTTATRIWVEQYAYFKRPATGCTDAAPAAAPAVKAAAAEPEPYNPTTVIQASPVSGGSLGTLELAYTDGIGRLMHGRAEPSALGSIQWTPVHGQEGYYGRPALGEQADGRLNVLAHNLNGDVWSRTQATKNPAAWGDWAAVEGPIGSAVTVARHDDTLAGFAVDTAGRLVALPQYAADDPYKGWIDLGVTGVSAGTAPLAVPVADGLRLFFLDASGAWQTALYARGAVSGCASLSGPGHTGTASVVTYPGSRLRIFVRSPDGHIVTKAQDGSGAFQATWDQVGDLVAAGSPSAVLSPGSGKTEVVARGTDDRVHSTGETIQGSGEWRAWADAQPEFDTSVPATDPTAFAYSGTNGPTWSYLFRTANQLTRLYWPEEETARLASRAPAFESRALPKPPAAS